MPPLIRPYRPVAAQPSTNGDHAASNGQTDQGRALPKVTPAKLPVCDKDLENLRASGLKDETIRVNSLHTEHDRVKLAKILKQLPQLPRKEIPEFLRLGGLVFPYRDLDGTLNGFVRLRPLMPRTIDGKPAKYEQPKGSSRRAYYPVASLEKLRDGESAVFITEGEKKALALSQLGHAAVGIGGLWCGTGSDHDLIDDLKAINWPDRVAYLVFDYDSKESTRRDSAAAQQRLARALKANGVSEVYSIELPPGPTGAKQGVDDFLVANGAEGTKAFESLIEMAIPVIKIIPATVATDDRANPPKRVIKIIPPTLGEDAYHGFIGEFLRAVAPFTEATDAGVLAHLLPAIGTIIGPGPYVWAGTKQPPRINTVLVGPTSAGRKGTALAPVDVLMGLVDPNFWREQRVGGLSTGEGLVQRVADKERWNEESKTKEIEYVEKRLYVVEEEFSKILAQLRREGNVLSQILRESYDSGNLAVLTRKNPIQAFGAHICITGHITPEELHDRFNHVEMANGFGNRFAWFAVKSDKVMALCNPIPATIYQKFVPRLQELSNNRAVVIGGLFRLATPAMERWEKEIYPYLRDDRPGFGGALLARGSSIVLRIALIYYLLDLPFKGDSQGIGLPHLDAAIAVWKYCEESVQQLFRTRAGTLLGDKVLALLADGQMTKDKLNDHLSPKQKTEIEAVLANLEQAGLVVKTREKKTGAGRPATAWALVK